MYTELSSVVQYRVFQKTYLGPIATPDVQITVGIERQTVGNTCVNESKHTAVGEGLGVGQYVECISVVNESRHNHR